MHRLCCVNQPFRAAGAGQKPFRIVPSLSDVAGGEGSLILPGVEPRSDPLFLAHRSFRGLCPSYGQNRLAHMRLLLTQHRFAVAAGSPLPCSEDHRTRRSPSFLRTELRLQIRRNLVRPASCGQSANSLQLLKCQLPDGEAPEYIACSLAFTLVFRRLRTAIFEQLHSQQTVSQGCRTGRSQDKQRKHRRASV